MFGVLFLLYWFKKCWTFHPQQLTQNIVTEWPKCRRKSRVKAMVLKPILLTWDRWLRTSEPTNSTFSNGLALKRPHKLLSKKQVEKTILTTSSMDSLQKKIWERYLTNSFKSTSVVPSANYLKCICRLLEIKYLESVILVLSLAILIISTG